MPFPGKVITPATREGHVHWRVRQRLQRHAKLIEAVEGYKRGELPLSCVTAEIKLIEQRAEQRIRQGMFRLKKGRAHG